MSFDKLTLVPREVLIAFGLLALVAIAAAIWGLVLERRAFIGRGKGAGWFAVRVAMLPILAATAGALFVPMWLFPRVDTLITFVAGLVTTVPLAWFGLHLIVGKLSRPSLTAGEATQLAIMPVAAVIILVVAGHALQPIAWTMARTQETNAFVDAVLQPSPYSLESVSLIAQEGNGIVAATWRGPAEWTPARIDMALPHFHVKDAGKSMLHQICQEPGAIHVAWPADTPLPPMQIYWRNASGALQRADLPMPSTLPAAVPFAVTWSDNGFSLPRPFSRHAVQTSSETASTEPRHFSNEAGSMSPVDSPEFRCLPSGWKSARPVAWVAIAISRTDGGPAVWLKAARP